MADEFDKNELENHILELNKLVVFRYRDKKLTGKQQRQYNAFGWYADSIGDALWESNQKLSIILDELASQNRALNEKLSEALEQVADYKKTVEVIAENIRNLNRDRQEIMDRLAALENRTAEPEGRPSGGGVSDEAFEEFCRWSRSCVDEHNARFDSHDKRLDDNNARFDGIDKRLDDNNARFDGIDKRLDENNARFDVHDGRLDDIEKREVWTRSRFNECFDRLHRLDVIIDGSIDKKELSVDGISEDGYILNRVMLNNREFFLATSPDAEDSISEAARKDRIICANTELLNLFGDKGTFLDIGANIGVFSLSFASQGWRGIAIEAGTRNFGVLRKAVRVNGFDIKVINKAVYDRTGSIFFVENGPEGYIRNSITNETDFTEIPAVAPDDLLDELKKEYESIDLIKMDVEGSEAAAVRGMKKLLEAYGFPPVFAESNVYTLSLQNESPISLCGEMEKLGYITCVFENGRLYRYDKTDFQTEYCTDRMFIHSSRIGEMNVLPRRDVDEQAVISLINEKINSYIAALDRGDLSESGRDNAEENYVFYLLQFYPQLIDKDISRSLEYIYDKQKDNAYIGSILRWIKGENNDMGV